MARTSAAAGPPPAVAAAPRRLLSPLAIPFVLPAAPSPPLGSPDAAPSPEASEASLAAADAAPAPAAAPAKGNGCRVFLVAHCDGGARGNGRGRLTGPSGFGFVLRHRLPEAPDLLSAVLYQACGYLQDGRAHGGTNNAAEYRAIIAALKAAKGLGATDLEVYSDSALAINQLTNRSSTKANHLVLLRNEAREAASGLRVTYFHLEREYNTLADKAANKAMDDKADSELFSAAGLTLRDCPPEARANVGCKRPKPAAPWLYPEGGGEDRPAAKDPGAGCVVCGDPFSSDGHGPLLACDCGSPDPRAALVCGKYCHAGCAGLEAAPVGGLPFYCPGCTLLHGPAPEYPLAHVSVCAECDAQFRPPSLNHKSCPTCLEARGGGGRGRGGRGRGRGAGRGGGRGAAGVPARDPAGPAALPAAGPIRAPPPHRGPPTPLTFPLPMLGLLEACGPESDPAWLLAQLAHVRPPIIPTVPAPARGLLQEVLRSVLSAMLQAEGKAADLAWALFLSFTPLLLSATPAADRSSCSVSSSIKANVRDLQEGHLGALIDRAADRALSHLAGVGSRQGALEGLSSTARANILAERAARSASKHVMSGRIGLGVRCLERAPAAPSGSDTREKLRALHPSAPPRDAARWAAVLSPVVEEPAPAKEADDEAEVAEPDHTPVLKYLKAHRGGAGGPDGLTAGLLLDIIGTRPDLLDLLNGAIEAIQQARAPPFIMAELANATLYALGKKAAPVPSASPDDPHSAAPSGDAAVQGPVSARTRQHSQAAAEGSVEVPGRPAPRRTRSSSAGPRPGSAADPNAAASEMARGMRGDSGEAPSAPPAPAVGVRPIAIGSILRRLAARLLLARDRSEVEAALGKAQYGFTPSGRESIMVQINTLLDLHPDWVVAGLDIKNAFNTVSRLTMLEECRTRLPQLFPLARACYADASTLFYRDDDGYHDFASAAGSQQGDPFGGVLFALAYRTVLDRLQAAFPDLHVFCFWDDTSLVGPADLVARAIQWLSGEEGAALVDLSFNDTKLQAWSPRAVPPAGRAALARAGVGAANLAPPESGIEMLGVFLGSPAYIKAGLAKKLAKHTAVLGGAAWGKLESRAQLLCLTFSISRRAHDTARFARPDLLIGAAKVHDKAILGAFAAIIGYSPHSVSDATRRQVELRCRLSLLMGGVGFRILEDAILAGFVGGTLDGRAIALERLCCDAGHRDAEVRAALKGFASIPPVVIDQGGAGLELAAEGSVGQLLHRYLGLLVHLDRRARLRNEHLESVIAAAPGAALVPAAEPIGESRIPFVLQPDNIAKALGDSMRRFQQLLQRVVDEDLLASLLQLFYDGYEALPPGEAGDQRRSAAHALRHQLEGAGGRGAGAWLYALPGSSLRFRNLLSMSSPEFITGIQLRLHLPLGVLVAAGVEAPGEGGTCPLLPSSFSGAPATPAARPAGAPGRKRRRAPRHQLAQGSPPAPAADDLDRPPPSGEEAAVDRDALTTVSSRPQTAPTSRPGACSQPLDHCGRHLLQCVRGGSLKARHDRIARALALIAPHGTTGLCAHLPVSATADEHKVYKFMCILAPERADPNSANPDDTTRWAKADAFVPAHELIGGGKPTFIDVTVARADAPGRSASYTPIEDLLLDLEKGKRDHYVDELAPGGPLHHANFVPFVLETGGRLGLEADALLKSWARLAAGDDMKFAKMSTMATFILRQYREVVGVALQRGNALMVQRAVGDIGNDVSRFISLSDASGGGHLPDFFGAVAAGSA